MTGAAQFKVRYFEHLIWDIDSIPKYDKEVLCMAEKVILPGGLEERMEDLRNRRKITLKELSEKTGFDCSTLSRIENENVKTVGDDVLRKLARFFGVSADSLLGVTDVPDKKNYTIEALGLQPEAARYLYTGAADSRVIDLLLAHPGFERSALFSPRSPGPGPGFTDMTSRPRSWRRQARAE